MINGADIYIRFLNGDKEAFVELIREYKSGLLLFINTFVKNIIYPKMRQTKHFLNYMLTRRNTKASII